MEFNTIKFVFTFLSVYVGVIGTLINFIKKYLPTVLIDTYLYGKTSNNVKSNFFTLKVPKRWFKHFYVFASVWTTFFFILVGLYYMHIIHNIPEIVRGFVSLLTVKESNTTVSATSTLLALFLLTIQAFRRFYETHYVSVFSNSTMDILHYIVGYTHYFGAVLAIVSESPGFAYSDMFGTNLQIIDISFTTLLASLIFAWAWWNQFQSCCTLANLRKNKKGEVVTEEHRVPNGGLFTYVSSPHNTCEIILYMCLSVILYKNTTFLYILSWVFINQVETALLTHWWYLKTFKNYPKERKAIIPFFL